MLAGLFKAIDNKDHAAFAAFLSPECVFRFANQPEVAGSDSIEEYVKGFFASISGLSHIIEEKWNVDDGIICRGTVTYTRMDDSQLSVPFANILKTNEGKITHYSIYADTSELYK